MGDLHTPCDLVVDIKRKSCNGWGHVSTMDQKGVARRRLKLARGCEKKWESPQ